MSTWSSLSSDIEHAVSAAAASVVQVHGRRRMTAGIVVTENHILTPASADDDTIAVSLGDGQTAEGTVLGRGPRTGLTLVRVEGLGRPALTPAPEPTPGHLAVAIGRTWSGGVMATLAPVSVVGGPLRAGRGFALDRVIRIQQAPHGALNGGALIDANGHALGLVTSMAIRGTTVVIPAAIAWGSVTDIERGGGARQGFLGVSTLPVAVPARQRATPAQEFGLLITQIAPASPADDAGLLVGDIIVGFGGEALGDPEELIMRLRGNRVGTAVPVAVIRGAASTDVTVTVGERPRIRG